MALSHELIRNGLATVEAVVGRKIDGGGDGDEDAQSA
jgi:hypothetical protein